MQLPLKLPVFLGAAIWLALPVNQAMAQRGHGGGGRGGGVHVSAARVGGGAVHVNAAHISGSRPMGPGAGHITRPIAPNRGQGFRNGNGVFIGFGGGGYWWPGLYGYDGYYGGIGGAPYYGDGYQSFYPPGDVFGTPMPGAVLPGSETAPTPRVATALVLVIVPTEDAELWFNGAKTQTRGQKREFLTPELPPGQIFTYEVKVRWTENGKENERTRTVRVQAGSQSVVNFQVEDREQLPLPIQVAPPPIKM